MSRKIKNILYYDTFRQQIHTKSATIRAEGDGNMKEYYLKSLQMIKKLNIQNEKQYNELLHYYKILSSESLKYISQTRRFKKIIKIAKEM
jgi:hypothetical protein